MIEQHLDAEARLDVPGLTDVAVIGEGSFGLVYRARQPECRREVAVKVLTAPLLDEEARYRFEAEREAIEIGVKVAGALADAHAAGVLHRDVKPENILVDEFFEPQLADFGVARVSGCASSATAAGTITGSLAHAAPEVIAGEPATAAVDVWALASTLSTLLAGSPPFSRPGDDSLVPLLNRIVTTPPRDLRLLGVPDAAAAVIERGLTKNAGERPQTAIEFGHLLQAAQRELGLPPTPIKTSSLLRTAAAADVATESTGAELSEAEEVTGAVAPEVADADPSTAQGLSARTRRLAALLLVGVAALAGALAVASGTGGGTSGTSTPPLEVVSATTVAKTTTTTAPAPTTAACATPRRVSAPRRSA